MPRPNGSTPQMVTIETCDPPTAFAATIATPDGPWPLRLTLTTQGDQTVLHFTHRLNEPYDASNVGPGWQYYLDRLGALLVGEKLPENFGAYHPRLSPKYAIPES